MMEWTEFPWGSLITIGGLMLTVALLAMDERNRRKFCSREDVNGLSQRIDRDLDALGRKVERNAGLFVAIDDRTGDLEEKTALLEERQSQQWERISEQMSHTAETIREVTRELKEVAKMQQDFALRLERTNRNAGD